MNARSLRTGAPIILLLPDQLRADALGAAGNSFVRTPHIDRLARESVRFEVCITNAPLCRPARTTLMTGQPVAVHGIATNLRAPDPVLPSHVRALRDRAGYHTAVVGKTHLHNGGGHLDAHREVLERWGFCEALELPDAQRHDVRSAHADWLSATTSKGKPDKFDRWRDYIAYSLRTNVWELQSPDMRPWELATDDHIDSFCARRAASLIAAYRGDRPLYLQIGFPGPHPPFDAPQELLSPLDPDAPNLPLPILEASTGPVSPVAQRYKRRRRNWAAAEARQLRWRYYAKVGLIDRGIGRVMDALEASGLHREAWIILTSDHGELLGDHHYTGKVLSYESSIRVPLLIRPPGGTAARTDPEPVDLMDVAATIMEVAGLQPAHPAATPLATRVINQQRRASAGSGRPKLFENMGYVGIRTDTATLTWDRRLRRPVELFDRISDPAQLHNVVEQQLELALELVSMLREHGAI